ncbi:MAG TPA: peptidylprolyl isomerase [Terriglobales bacterium]
MMMQRYGLVCLLFGALAWGQATPQGTAPAAAPAQKPAAAADKDQAAAPKPPEDTSANVAMDATVVTVDGLCENPPADKSAGTCKTTFTREQFEKVLNAVQPNMPPRGRRQFANRYVNALIMANQAHAQGLDQGPAFEQRMALARIQILSQLLNQSMQEKAGQVSDEEIKDYYEKNKADFEEAEMHRIFIPKTVQQNSKVKLTAAEQEKATKAGEATMKAEADKIRTRAAAGEDLAKLQEEAFTVAGIKTKAPSTDMGQVRRNGLPPAQAPVMDLKTGAVSEVFTDASGYFVYKVGAKDTLALDKVDDEIKGTLRGQRLQAEMKDVQQSATINLDEAYFGPDVPQRPGMPGMPPGMPGRPGPPGMPQRPTPPPPSHP